ncbi:hypothetical protein G6F37_012346 [Rhizopus arrhizus]|nr:hypothetical protein G6F38_012256 [Rhizopus arrhizus]KAG1144109.1 hypothetical protein G6F37_012346 [Rhizopus arrhizus]
MDSLHLSKAAHRVEQLLQQFAQRLRTEESYDKDSANLPDEVFEELGSSSKSELQANLKRYTREIPKYKGSQWTTPETINKEFTRDLKKYTVESYQLIMTMYKNSERVRLQARAAAEVFEEFKNGSQNGGSEDDFAATMEKLRRLSIYGFVTAKEIDHEAKQATFKALRLPESVKHLAEDEPGEKVFAIDQETVERIHKARYEQSVLRSATSNGRGGYSSFRGRGNFNFQHRGRPFNGRPFFGRGRGRTFTPAEQQPSYNQNNNQTNNQ